MINRIKGPTIKSDFNITIPPIEEYHLDNGLKVFELYADSYPITKIEFCSKSGRINEKKPAIARISLRLMREASQRMDSDQLAEHFDFYGAEMGNSLGLDSYRFGMSALSSKFNKVFPVWVDLLTSPRFAREDLTKIQSLSAQKLKTQLSKNNVVAYREFTKNIFGEKHLYGYNTLPEQILDVSLQEAQSYYDDHIGIDNAVLFVSGKLLKEDRKMIDGLMGQWKSRTKEQALSFENLETESGKKHLEFGQDKQYSIKIGKRLFPRKNKDYAGMFVLNTILGGYFGSRLMSKIREEKGYSYNIYSNIDALVHDGYWYISAEVGNEFVDATITEIYKILKSLREDLIPEGELKMVKNYLQGHLLSLFDGPFSSARILQSVWKYDLELDDIQKFIKTVRDVDSLELRALANKYLGEEGMIELTVGKTR